MSILVLATSIGLPINAVAQRVSFQEVTGPAGLAGFNRFSWGFGGDGVTGVAAFDYNDDGLLDIYITNGKDITSPPSEGFDNGLFENQGGGVFINVAAAKGVTYGKGSAGVIAGDVDNDGDQDIFLTGDGGMLGNDQVTGLQTIDAGVVLYVNNGPPDYDFTPADNLAVGLTGFEGTTQSAAFADIDNDALLDLVVTSSGTPPEGCQPPSCDPDDPTIRKHSNRVYWNRSNGGQILFQDITDESNVGVRKGGALALVFNDYNQDGLADLYIANGAVAVAEPTPVELWENTGPGVGGIPSFVEVTNDVGLNTQSAWMGFALGDFDNNGTTELFVTNAGQPPHALFRWFGGPGRYFSLASFVGLDGPDPSPATYFGWGATGQDFDLDGRTDLFFAGSFGASGIIGEPRGNPGVLVMNDPANPPLGMNFVDFTDATGVDLRDRNTAGVAGADFNNDGYTDLLIGTDNFDGDLGVPVLLRNATQNDNRWLTVRLAGNGTTSNRDAVGARIRIRHLGDTGIVSQIREVYGGSSFLSMDSQWQTFGLGASGVPAQVRVGVDWPDGIPGNYVIYGPFPTNQIVDIVQADPP